MALSNGITVINKMPMGTISATKYHIYAATIKLRKNGVSLALITTLLKSLTTRLWKWGNPIILAVLSSWIWITTSVEYFQSGVLEMILLSSSVEDGIRLFKFGIFVLLKDQFEKFVGILFQEIVSISKATLCLLETIKIMISFSFMTSEKDSWFKLLTSNNLQNQRPTAWEQPTLILRTRISSASP